MCSFNFRFLAQLVGSPQFRGGEPCDSIVEAFAAVDPGGCVGPPHQRQDKPVCFYL